MRSDIIDYAKQLPPLTWPPPVDELLSDKRKPPESLILFLTHLLRSEKHKVTRSENIGRLIESYSADLVHGVTRGSLKSLKIGSLKMEVLKFYTEISGLTCCDESSMTSIAAVVIDFIALVRTMVEIPNTFEGLALKLLKLIPSGYPRIYLVADTYRTQSMKNAERESRGTSSRILVRSVQSKIPRDFSQMVKTRPV